MSYQNKKHGLVASLYNDVLFRLSVTMMKQQVMFSRVFETAETNLVRHTVQQYKLQWFLIVE